MIIVKNITDIINHLDGIKVVIFDLDDTLYSEKEYVRSGYHEVMKLLPNITNVEEKLWLLFSQGKSAIDELLINENCYSEELKNNCLKAYRNQQPNIHLYDGVKDMLKKLVKEGYRLGMITDGRPNGQSAKIKSLDLEKYFDKIIITDELGGLDYRKPNPLSYKIMKDYFGFEYHEMCYIGDNINKDFISSKRLHIRSIYFDNYDGIYNKGVCNE